MEMKLPITSITPFTFQDYPEHTACILWFSGCNMACGYCHNPELVKGTLRRLPPQYVKTFLESRTGLLEGVVLSGGECTLSPALPSFINYLKFLEFKVKLDTNGTNPGMLAELLELKLVDYVALDFKAPAAKFSNITGSDNYPDFRQSLAILCHADIDLEIRTTVHADMLDEDDINEMIAVMENCGFRGTYYLQPFRSGKTLANLSAPAHIIDAAKLSSAFCSIQWRNH